MLVILTFFRWYRRELFHILRYISVTTSFGGTAWERDEMKPPNDAVLDFWHPLEKAQYPDYFARREQRKKEFVEWYDKKYGRPKAHEY